MNDNHIPNQNTENSAQEQKAQYLMPNGQPLPPNVNPYVPQPIMKSSIEKNMIGYFKNRTNTVIAIWLSLFIGVIFTFLVVEYSLKLNLFIFYTLLLAVTGFIMYRDDNLNIKMFAFFSVAFLSLASVFFRTSFSGYIVISAISLPIIFVLMTVLASKQKYASNIKTFLLRAVCSIGFVDKIFIALSSLRTKENTKSKRAVHILIGAGVTIALLCIIVPLMVSADLMFRTTLNNMFGNFRPLSFILKSMLSAFLAMVFFGFIYIITAKRLTAKKVETKKEMASITTVILTVIIALAVVFSFFAIVQFNYLFVGVKSNLPANFDFAEYARNGYFQLVVLSVINFFIILTCVHLSKNGSAQAKKAVRIILAYFNAINIYLLVSATYKMALYQSRFGLTSSRLLVYILLAFEAVLLIGLMVKIFKENLPFVKYAILYSTMFWAIASFVNVEAIALKYNISTQYEQGEFDFGDIRWLSADSSKVVYEFYNDNYSDFGEDELKSIKRYYRLSENKDRVVTRRDYWIDNATHNWREVNIADISKYYDGISILKTLE